MMNGDAAPPDHPNSPFATVGARLRIEGVPQCVPWRVGLISFMINLLYLTGSIFMLEVYDRVLPSRSVPTLVGLVILAGGLYIAQGFLDLLRSRILGRIGLSLDEALSARVYRAVVQLPLIVGNRNEGLQPIRDLDAVRGFLASMGPSALFDLPWLPLYLGICFAFHVLIGVTALAGAIILVALTLLTEFLVRRPSIQEATRSLGSARRSDIAAASRRNAEALVAMGMADRLAARWNTANAEYLTSQQRAADVSGGVGAIAKVARMMLQSSVLAVGAWLVNNHHATGGIIIASSILSARALAPVDLAIAHWKNFAGARQSWQRLNRMHSASGRCRRPWHNSPKLEAPSNKLQVEALSIAPAGEQKVVVQDVSFVVEGRPWRRYHRAERVG